jgi:hypothetical protein
LATDPAIVDRVRERLKKERAEGRRKRYWWIDEWLEILDRPIVQLRRDITKDTDKWQQMRSVSPLGLASGLTFFQDLEWRRRAIRKVRNGLVMMRARQWERAISGSYKGDGEDPRSNILDNDELIRRIHMHKHRMVARRIAFDPSIIEQYRERLEGKLAELGGEDHWWVRKWLCVLSKSPLEVRRVITTRSAEWDVLRYHSFFGAYLPSLDTRDQRRMLKRLRMGLMLKMQRDQRWQNASGIGPSQSYRP